MKYKNIREEELKNKVGVDFFTAFDTTKIVGNVDFCVTTPSPLGSAGEELSLLWAEAKKGDFDIYAMFAQLILTIGKERTFDKYLPPAFLGAFDGKKIAFVAYNTIIDVFSMNDFNWNVAPSKHDTKEFLLIKERITKSLDENNYLYDFLKDEAELKFFIKNNIAKATESSKIRIDKNNFVNIYLRWLEHVKPHIDLDWSSVRKNNILDSDFYLADLFVDDHDTSSIEDDTPLTENLFVVFKNSHYEILNKNLDGMFKSGSNVFSIKNIVAYEQFWKKYKRPPLEEFQQYIINRRDLLVPQDIRERKGAYFTPREWVELSQKYIADVLGEDWQEEYYVWDCAAGTGNLLAGLTNKYNIWASTLEMADVNVIHENIDQKTSLLLKDHVFQFDFLNDDFSKLPQSLQNIIKDPEKRKKLVVYINPPYAEADNRKGEGRIGVGISKIKEKYESKMGYTKRELYIQFHTRIFFEISGCVLADFSTLKNLQAPKFVEFRDFFKAKLQKCFIVPADTFDNVKGSFPIGFKIWNTDIPEDFNHISADVYDDKGSFIGLKNIWAYDRDKLINDWVKLFRYNSQKSIATIIGVGSDFQNQRLVRIDKPNMKVPASNHNWQITSINLIESSIYYAVRHCIEATWINDRDQFLYPNNGWEKDKEFQSDCLTYTLFSNNIQSKYGTNHWIPFTEEEVGARAKFESNFMTQYIKGKIRTEDDNKDNLFEVHEPKPHYEVPLLFSEKAQAVFDAGRTLWKYYHQCINKAPSLSGRAGEGLVNASLYDIRNYFQGRNDKGKMNSKSTDEDYNLLIKNLRKSLKILAKKIEPKVYEYGFLKE